MATSTQTRRCTSCGSAFVTRSGLCRNCESGTLRLVDSEDGPDATVYQLFGGRTPSTTVLRGEARSALLAADSADAIDMVLYSSDPALLDAALDHEHELVRYAAVRNLAAAPHTLQRAATASDPLVRHAAMEHENLTPAMLEPYLTSEDPKDRVAATSNPSATVEQLERAFADDVAEVRAAVVCNPSASNDQRDRAVRDESVEVRLAASWMPGELSTDQWAYLSSDSDRVVRATTYGRNWLTQAQLLSAVQRESDPLALVSIAESPSADGKVLRAILKSRRFEAGAAKTAVRRRQELGG